MYVLLCQSDDRLPRKGRPSEIGSTFHFHIDHMYVNPSDFFAVSTLLTLHLKEDYVSHIGGIFNRGQCQEFKVLKMDSLIQNQKASEASEAS